jgi:hypothetical protein
MTPWVRRTLAAYRFNTSCRIPGVGLSDSGVVGRSIPVCTSRPAAARYVQISERSRELSADYRSRTMPKMSGIHASNVCGAGDVFGCLDVYSIGPTVCCLGQQCKDEPGFIGYRWLDLFPRRKGTTSLICIYFAVLSYVNSGKVLAHSCLGLLPVYELPSSRYCYPLASTVANLAKLTPERPALIRHHDDRQAPESGLDNLSVRCQRASRAVAAMVCPTQ